MVYFTPALALFEHCSYRAVWGKLAAAPGPLSLWMPTRSPRTQGALGDPLPRPPAGMTHAVRRHVRP
ncbi:hypothetical protein [Streptomyces sp. NPDC021212]|uniref:hypothetical protein n=1 Tax=Streptomyces sp. NPDC021212 TaxID=3365118 RepID=UPI00379C140D